MKIFTILLLSAFLAIFFPILISEILLFLAFGIGTKFALRYYLREEVQK